VKEKSSNGNLLLRKRDVPSVLFSDSYLLVLNKPAGWITNTADTTTDQPVLQKWIEQSYTFWKNGKKDSDFYNRAGIVHRIDKETSGCLLVAKDEITFAALQAQFKQRLVKKTYIALTHGKIKQDRGVIDAGVGRLPWRRDRFGVLLGGRGAQSSYKVIEHKHKNKEDFTLVEFTPTTGRTHQIRIHAKYIGHPLVADSFYAGRKAARADRVWCPRLFLHAAKISFTHPETGKAVTVEAPMPKDLLAALHTLEEKITIKRA
jgi:23S rRNA pseudouridine1911/1915/1917 synthase